MTGGILIGSYTSSKASAGSILMIQGINQSMTMTWFDQRITCGQTMQKTKHGERLRTRKATHTVQRTGHAATVTLVDPTTWDASMDVELENTRAFNTVTTPLIVRQLLTKLGKHHTKAMAGRKQKWLRTTCNRFDIQMIRGRSEMKHMHIEDAEEMNRTIKQEYEDFLEDYECIVFGH
jgi:hypothetical protein